ncbi:thioredoxin domain-containing protein [Zavarzinella formosa]|uniref:hypothetical protein n=1 Tax=Zavarzinella formosa TaxID=360055 RepID=UPI00035D46C7|nr:hypothetical protein [Zavarzinella formosa]
MRCCLLLAGICVLAGTAFGEAPPPPVKLAMLDQFDQKHDLRDFRGDVVILLYGDRKATDANKELGEKLHIHYHPTAKTMKPADAHKAPVLPLEGSAKSPNVHVIPVACTGPVPELVMSFVKREVKKASPDMPLWFDTANTMKDVYGLREGEPNLIVVDAEGRMRFRVLGEADAKTKARLIEVVDYLRTEAAR